MAPPVEPAEPGKIPIIDFSQFLSGDKHAKLTISKAVARGFQDVGFIYLQNHNIPQRDVDQMFSASARFFDMPQTQKDSFAWGMHGGSNSPGYTPYGVEKLTQSFNQAEIDELRATNPDMKEAFDVGLERIRHGAENIWPGQMDEPMEQMKLVVQSFFEKCRQVQTEVMSAIALGLGLPETYFDRLIDDADNSLRCLHYPSVKAEVFEKNTASVRAGAHSDYGSITLLFQDASGGLQVSSQEADGRFVDATPIAGTIVVNAGDMLARWSNDTIKSTVHRVVQPPMSLSSEETHYSARYSIAYFCNPNMTTVIEALPGTWDGQNGKKYKSITAGDWLMKRLQLGHDAKTLAKPGPVANL